jgi:hypothetical protein
VREELVAQLVTLLNSRLVDPLEILLDPSEVDTMVGVRAGCARAALVWADRLLGDDDADAVHAAASLIGALYPGDGRFDPPAAWWRTPLGRVIALRIGHPDTDPVSYAVAGAMLGVTRQAVHDLVTRGKLARHTDGGVTVDSVRSRLNEQLGKA